MDEQDLRGHEPKDLSLAAAQEVTESLAYALGFDERGKPARKLHDFATRIVADRVLRMLNRSGYVVMRLPPSDAGFTSVRPRGGHGPQPQ
ncbi:hypothetical protein [Pseudoroseomonas cervicalis]|uniref:hypothetical protein n=1 Tax=Teichococcus cervicalis TaxID=204525 RepID=UPI002780F4EF|nr:hypothetical protein [Pseudoroseomonas cervicalis]MDQ1078025.1 hypothetical protein [Pseudoroseomonas cervicalis]